MTQFSFFRNAAASFSIKHLMALALLVCSQLLALQARASVEEHIENQHPLLNEVCQTPASLVASDDLVSLMRRAVQDVVWQGKTFRSWSDLGLAAMGDIQVKHEYFKKLARYSGKRSEIQKTFQEKRTQILSMQLSASMHEAMQYVRLIPFEEFLAKDLEEMSTFFLGWKSRGHHLELACGADGLALSAFYYHPEDLVVICPGTEMRLALGELEVSSLDFLIAHEIGHALDTNKFPGFYRQTREKWGIRPVFLNESAADYWAAKTLANASLSHLQENLGLMCSLPEVRFGSLPYRSGYQRINFILNQAFERP